MTRLLGLADVRRLLTKHGIAPHKERGQNFVVDPNTVRKLVRDAEVRPDELVCEIGPGLGSLTLGLREAGARVVAVEVDAGLVRALEDVLGDDAGVTIIHADALGVDYAELAHGGPVAMVANLPYNIATAVVVRALEADAFNRLFVMVQREVGQRWAARPREPLYGAVSVKLAALARVEIVGRVSRTAFYPVPNVDSVTVRLRPRVWEGPLPRARVFALVEEGFSQRRKRLRNALAGAERPAARVEESLVAVGLDPGARAEELGLAAWLRLAEALTD